VRATAAPSRRKRMAFLLFLGTMHGERAALHRPWGAGRRGRPAGGRVPAPPTLRRRVCRRRRAGPPARGGSGPRGAAAARDLARRRGGASGAGRGRRDGRDAVPVASLLQRAARIVVEGWEAPRGRGARREHGEWAGVAVRGSETGTRQRETG